MISVLLGLFLGGAAAGLLPLSSAAGALAGIVTGMMSSTASVWLVVLAYWLAGTAHGLLAWRLARGGALLPPESI
jgi:hypothetical protein